MAAIVSPFTGAIITKKNGRELDGLLLFDLEDDGNIWTDVVLAKSSNL